MPARKDAPKPRRSVKAKSPVKPAVQPPRVRRRDKTAQTAVRKDTMMMQTDHGPRARWSASRSEWKKR